MMILAVIILGMLFAILLMLPIALAAYAKGRKDQLEWLAKNNFLRKKK